MQMSVQIFAIQLLSQLCTQYALPKSLSVARLAISVMGTLLTGDAVLCLFTHETITSVSVKNDVLALSADPC